MAAHRNKERISYKKINEHRDPLKLELHNTQEGKPKQPRGGRHTLSVTMWDKLDSTPYGRFNQMPPAAPPAERAPTSKVRFDHYNFARGPEAVALEYPKGKRVVPPPHAAPPFSVDT